MREKVSFDTGEHIELPEGMTVRDFSRAAELRSWRINRKGASIAGRPAWIAKLPQDEIDRLQTAVDFVDKVENNPEEHFKK